MPRSSFVIAFALLVAALLASAAMRAGEAPPSVKPAEASAPSAPDPSAPGKDLPQFTLLDVNGDTVISAGEAQAHARLAAIFAECDADKNGSLNTWEFAEARSKLQ